MAAAVTAGLLLCGAAYPTPKATGIEGALLRGHTIVIDPGHGGMDSGAKGLKAREDDVNLAVALQLRRCYEEAGAKVLMTWDKKEQIPSTKKYRVRERMTWINHTPGTVLINIHCNSAGATWSGPQTFYWDGRGSYYLAHDVQEELQYFTHTRRSVTRINQYVLRYAKMPAINVEVGFISNPREETKLMDPVYQRSLARCIFLGSERWFLKGYWPEKILKSPPPTHLLVRD